MAQASSSDYDVDDFRKAMSKATEPLVQELIEAAVTLEDLLAVMFGFEGSWYSLFKG